MLRKTFLLTITLLTLFTIGTAVAGSLPQAYDYNPEHDETIVTTGVTGFVVSSVTLDLDRKVIQIVASEGVLAADGRSLEAQTKENKEVRLSGQDTTDFYVENKAAIDALFEAAMKKWAADNGKTGAVIY